MNKVTTLADARLIVTCSSNIYVLGAVVKRRRDALNLKLQRGQASLVIFTGTCVPISSHVNLSN